MDSIRFDAPGDYAISIQGIIGKTLLDKLGSAEISFKNTVKGTKSVIHIAVKDQAHLMGILNMLNGALCVIISVKMIAADTQPQ